MVVCSATSVESCLCLKAPREFLRLVNYELCHAIPIFEGKVDKENESTQEPAQAASEIEKF